MKIGLWRVPNVGGLPINIIVRSVLFQMQFPRQKALFEANTKTFFVVMTSPLTGSRHNIMPGKGLGVRCFYMAPPRYFRDATAERRGDTRGSRGWAIRL